MKTFLTLVLIADALCAAAGPRHTGAIGGDAPVAFIENKGQIVDQHGQPRPDVAFKLSDGRATVFAGSGKLYYQFTHAAADAEGVAAGRQTAYRLDMTLQGANPNAMVTADGQQPYFERYYGPAGGAEGITTRAFQKITYHDVYPGIDWVLYVKDDALKYDFVVQPGGRVSDIRMVYKGATALRLTKAGALEATTPLGFIRESAPVSYDAVTHQRIESHFVLRGSTVSFDVKAPSASGLVIDPQLDWTTFYGASNNATTPASLTTDASGQVYMAGSTAAATNIATVGAHQTTLNGTDGFLVKFTPAGVRLWATYYGGTGADAFAAITCAPNGDVLAAGNTASTGFISTTGSQQPSLAGGTDGFLVRFNPSGVRQWGTYYGGPGADDLGGVAVSPNGSVYVSGLTASNAGIATPGAYQTSLPNQSSAFIVKFSPGGVRQWSTYYGGTLNESSEGSNELVCDTSGNVFLTGSTQSTSGIATAGSAFPTFLGGNYGDLFLAKFDSAGARVWATYVGSASSEGGATLATDGSNLFVGGSTNRTLTGVGDGYIASFRNGGQFRWAQTIGTGPSNIGDIVYGIASDNTGQAYVVGATGSSTMVATPGSFQPYLNGSAISGNTTAFSDAFFSVFDSTGVKTYSTYFNGPATEQGLAIARGDSNILYFAGTTTSTASSFATASAHQTAPGRAFLTRFNLTCVQPLPQPSQIAGDTSICPGTVHTYSIAPVPGAMGYTWALPSGWTGSSTGPSIIATAGTNSGTILVYVTDACGGSIVRARAVSVAPTPFQVINGSIMFCANQSRILSTGDYPSATYQWNLNGLPITGAINDSVTVSASGSYTVSLDHPALGCTTTSAPIVLTAYPLPTPVITVNGNVLSADPNYASYYWYKDGVWMTAVTNQSSITVTQNGYYSVVVQDNVNFCPGTSSAVQVCVSLMAGTPAISGPAVICQGGTYFYSISPVAGATSYTWTLPTGSSGSASGGTNAIITNAIIVTVGGVSGAITVTPSSNCATGITQSTNVTVRAKPVITAPDTAFCAGDSLRLYTANQPGTTYQWFYGTSPIPGATDTSLVVNIAGIYAVSTVATATTGNCVFTSTPVTITSTPLPVPVVTVAGAVLSTGTFATYQWLFNGSPIAGATAATYTAAQDGVYRVQVTSGLGCQGISSPVLVCNFPPAQPAAISGDSSVCGTFSYTYSVPPVPNATSYVWTLPVGWSGSSTSNTIIITPGPSGGAISVRAADTCGLGPVRSLAVSMVGQSTITVSGDTTFCAGDSVRLSTTRQPELFYQWYSGPTMLIPGATDTAITVYTSGQYFLSTLIATSGGLCFFQTLPITVTSHPLPVPAIFTTGPVLSTGTYATYEWLLNGSPIPGAAASTYTATQDGSYQVRVTDSAGCTGLSDTTVMVGTAVAAVSGQTSFLTIAPNPSNGWLTLQGTLPHQSQTALHLRGHNALGQLVFEETLSAMPASIRISLDWTHLPSGMYYLSVSTNGATYKLPVQLVR